MRLLPRPTIVRIGFERGSLSVSCGRSLAGVKNKEEKAHFASSVANVKQRKLRIVAPRNRGTNERYRGRLSVAALTDGSAIMI